MHEKLLHARDDEWMCAKLPLDDVKDHMLENYGIVLQVGDDVLGELIENMIHIPISSILKKIENYKLSRCVMST